MENSILRTVRILNGIDADCEDFDSLLIVYANTVFMTLNQLGIGTKEVFSIEDDSAEWTDFYGAAEDVRACATYVGLKVKTMFDPSSNATIANAINEYLRELEQRLIHQVEIERNLIV